MFDFFCQFDSIIYCVLIKCSYLAHIRGRISMLKWETLGYWVSASFCRSHDRRTSVGRTSSVWLFLSLSSPPLPRYETKVWRFNPKEIFLWLQTQANYYLFKYCDDHLMMGDILFLASDWSLLTVSSPLIGWWPSSRCLRSRRLSSCHWASNWGSWWGQESGTVSSLSLVSPGLHSTLGRTPCDTGQYISSRNVNISTFYWPLMLQ